MTGQERRLRILMSLPVASLHHMSLKHRVEEFGRARPERMIILRDAIYAVTIAVCAVSVWIAVMEIWNLLW